MTIRLATLEDRDAIIALGWHFAQSDIYRCWLDGATEASIAAITDTMLAFGEQACIALALDSFGLPFGLIALLEVPNTITGLPFADELCWWVEPDRRSLRAGPALLAYAERWARARGLTTIKMVAPFGSTVGRFYERQGYRPVETAYAKTLGTTA